MSEVAGYELFALVWLLGVGIASVIIALRQMRRGQVVTPREIARWQGAMRRRGGDVATDVAEIMMLDGRVQQSWLRLGLGAGAIIAGMCPAILLALRIRNPDPNDVLFFAVLGGAAIALFIGGAFGALMGFSRMRRDPGVSHAPKTPQRLRDYCSPFAAVLPFLALVANLALMIILVMRLAPSLDKDALARAFALPGMWSVVVEPGLLLVLAIATIFVIQRLGALPLLYLPRDEAIRQRADNAMRRIGAWQVVLCFLLVAFTAGMGQFSMLALGNFPFIPLYMARLEGWYLIYLGVIAILVLVVLVLIRIPRRVRPSASARGDVPMAASAS